VAAGEKRTVSKIFRKTLIAVVLVFGVAANASALLSAWLLSHHLTETNLTNGRAIAAAIAASLPAALAAGDTTAVQDAIDAFSRLDGVGYVIVRDGRGRVLAHTLGKALPEGLPVDRPAAQDGIEVHPSGLGHFLQVTASVGDGKAGRVAVGMDKAGIVRAMRGAVAGQEGLMLLVLVVAIGVFYVLARTITLPLVELADYAVKIRDHDFSAVPPQTGDDEVGVLARAMRTMAGELSLLVSDLTRAVAVTTRELKDTLAHTQAIIDHLADGLLVIDPSGKVTQFNPALLSLFQLTPADVAGRAVANVFPAAMAELSAQACPGGGTASAEVRLAGGGTGKALATSVCLGEAAAGRQTTVILVRDITREKEVDRMKTEFISTVSHELRTPLTSVLGFAKILRRKFQDDIAPALPAADAKLGRCVVQIRSNLDIIVTEGQRLTELVDDVLDIAKMESGRYEWDMAPVSLTEVADHAVRAVASLAARKGLELRCDVPRNLPGILGDRDRLVQVLLNLLGNAVKFTTIGSVSLQAVRETDLIRVTVRDTGPGIAPADLERIFEKFKQAGDTLTEKPKGTGLGLSICRQIVEHHGGRIWVESQAGVGSTFIFTLPLTPGEVVVPPPACRLPDLPDPVAMDMECRRILVVDDDASVRCFLETVLSDAGYAVAQASSGSEALRLAASWRPDCITMDLRMPGMGGVEVIRSLRAGALTRDIPVVVVSVISDRERGSTGADAAVVKPVDQDALLATVRGLLSGHAHARPCLLYSPDGTRPVSRRFFIVPGEARECGDAEELWQAIRDGFRGTVFVPASRGNDLDLPRMCATPDIHIIIMPD